MSRALNRFGPAACEELIAVTLLLWYVSMTAVLAGALASVTFTQFVARRVRLPRRTWAVSVQPPPGRVQAPQV